MARLPVQTESTVTGHTFVLASSPTLRSVNVIDASGGAIPSAGNPLPSSDVRTNS